MKRLSLPLVLAIVVVALWALGGFLFPWFFAGDKLGEFGDKFGAVNALFSGLAFAGVIYAILLQREELQLQREELSMTRDELRRSADAQSETARALIEQLRLAALTSKLTACSSLLNSCNAKIAQTGAENRPANSDVFMSRINYEIELKKVLDEVNKIVTTNPS